MGLNAVLGWPQGMMTGKRLRKIDIYSWPWPQVVLSWYTVRSRPTYSLKF